MTVLRKFRDWRCNRPVCARHSPRTTTSWLTRHDAVQVDGRPNRRASADEAVGSVRPPRTLSVQLRHDYRPGDKTTWQSSRDGPRVGGLLALCALGVLMTYSRPLGAQAPDTWVSVTGTFGDDGLPTDTYMVVVKSGTTYTALFFDTTTGKYHTGTKSVTEFLTLPASEELDAEFAASCVAGGLADIDFVDANGNVVPVVGTEAFIPPDLEDMQATVTQQQAARQQAQQQQQQPAPPVDGRYGWFQWLRPQAQPTPPGGRPRFGPPQPVPVPAGRQRFFGGPTLILPNNPLMPRYWQQAQPGFVFGWRF